MRSEEEIMDLVMGLAREDDRVRAVFLNGSRANPKGVRDAFQDYDIVLVVSSVESFIQDRGWMERLGRLIMMQTPDEMDEPFESSRDSFAFLMLFQDGNRIDLTLHPVDKLITLQLDTPSSVLMDKDGLVGSVGPENYRHHDLKPPTERQFSECCNEFLWVSTYVAKGLFRRQLPYAMSMFDGPVRHMLDRMLAFYIGVEAGFDAQPGSFGKYFERYLPPGVWSSYLRTFPDADDDHIWASLFEMCHLFKETAKRVAGHFHYPYPGGDDQRVWAYLQHVRSLSPDAKEVY